MEFDGRGQNNAKISTPFLDVVFFLYYLLLGTWKHIIGLRYNLKTRVTRDAPKIKFFYAEHEVHLHIIILLLKSLVVVVTI